jgi:hypothetical protein
LRWSFGTVRWPVLSIASDDDGVGNCGGVGFGRDAESGTSGLMVLEGLSDERMDVLSYTRSMLHSDYVNVHMLPY